MSPKKRLARLENFYRLMADLVDAEVYLVENLESYPGPLTLPVLIAAVSGFRKKVRKEEVPK